MSLTRIEADAVTRARSLWQPSVGDEVRYDKRVRVVRPYYGTAKRAFDLVALLVSAPLVAPLMAICALAVRLDSKGPVFFRQQRTGRGGRRFGMFKFRTMVENADELKAQYMYLNELDAPDFKITDDPRVTRVGKILRKSSLDELPQLLNVLSGEMTLVGPRPTSFPVSTYDLWHTERLEVTPGITGLWQIRGRSDLQFDDRCALDIYYIENRSIRLDLAILIGTFTAVVSHRGAY